MHLIVCFFFFLLKLNIIHQRLVSPPYYDCLQTDCIALICDGSRLIYHTSVEGVLNTCKHTRERTKCSTFVENKTLGPR